MQNETVAIKKLFANDAAFLSVLATQIYRQHYSDTWYDGGQWYLQTYLSADRLKVELEEANALFFAVYYNEEAAGFLKLNLNKPLPGEAGSALELERVYLDEKVMGKGIGTHVMHFVIDLAKQKYFKLIWLKVMQSSPAAVAFYTKLGFEICGTHTVPFAQKKEGLRDMFIMKKCV